MHHLCVGVQRPCCGSPASGGLRADNNRTRSFSVGNPVQTESSSKLTFEFNLEDHIQKTRKAASYLKQLFHTQLCQGVCMATTCIRVASLLKHVNNCDNMECIQPGCNTTKSLLKHAKDCKAKNVMNPIKDGPFCLMCTIAGSDHGIPKTPCYEDSYDMRSFDGDERSRPLVCDEMIEFSRVPFQSMKSITPRAKTFSDSDFVVQVQVDQPHKKSTVIINMKHLDQLPFDTLVRISSFLSVTETQRVFLANSILFHIGQQPALWKHWFGLISKSTLLDLWHQRSMGRSLESAIIGELKELAREAFAISDLSKVQWKRLDYHPDSDQAVRLFPMEAHTMSLVYDRYLIIAGGWCRSPNANQISVIDAWAIPHQVLPIPTETFGNPVFRYGFSSIIWNGKVIVFGGCREGGYTGDCNDMYCISSKFYKSSSIGDISTENIEYDFDDPAHVDLFRNAPIKFWERIECTYSSNLTSTCQTINLPEGRPTERAYHGCCLGHFNNQDCMIVWGGLHSSDVIGQLEVYNLKTHTWMAVPWAGEEPSPRFGLSLVPVTNLNREKLEFEKIENFIVTGGSDGNDLIRNGDELFDIHILTIVRGANRQNDTDSFLWSHVNAGINMNMIPGRCHTATAIENYIIFFGGSADNSNTTTILKTKCISNEDNHFQFAACDNSKIVANSPYSGNKSNIAIQFAYPNFATSTKPSIRTSSAAAVVGRYMILFGGWSNNLRELGDFWALDLAPGLEVERRLFLDEASPNFHFMSNLLKADPYVDDISVDDDTAAAFQFHNPDGESGEQQTTDTNMFANPLFLQQVLALMGSNPGIDFTTAMHLLSTGAAAMTSGDQDISGGNPFAGYPGAAPGFGGENEVEDDDNPLGSNYSW